MTWTRYLQWGAVAILALGVFGHAACADEVERFYAGRKLSVVIGHEVGTGFDLYGRALTRHMGRFIPGNPTLVPENMLGVAGFAAANWLYNVAPKDGSVIAIFAHTAPFEPLLGKATGRFDASKFTWIGNMDRVVGVCGVSEQAGVSKFEDLLAKETLFGAGGAGTGGPLTQFPTAVKRLLGAKIKLIQGTGGRPRSGWQWRAANCKASAVFRCPRSRPSGETTSIPGASKSFSSLDAIPAQNWSVSRMSRTM